MPSGSIDTGSPSGWTLSDQPPGRRDGTGAIATTIAMRAWVPDAQRGTAVQKCAHSWGAARGIDHDTSNSRIRDARPQSHSPTMTPRSPNIAESHGVTWSLQRRYRPKASRSKRSRSPRSQRFRSCTCPIQCNTCATGAPETLTHQGLQAIASLSSQSVVLFRTAFSPVRAVWERHPREPAQYVRTTCARNPYVPRVSSDRVAFPAKRRSRNDRVLPGRSAFGSAPVRSDATRAQQVHREPLPAKGFKRSRRLSSDASLRETGLNIGR
jgi:hypothetical protein